MRKSTSNIIVVCHSHASKPGKYSKHKAKEFLGKFCKLGFRSASGQMEHMWVIVKQIKGNRLIGKLNNDPVLEHTPPLMDGDTVSFEVSDIEDIYKE